MYVYRVTGEGIWTTGFYAPDGTWDPESDHESAESAACRTAWLNGSNCSETRTVQVLRESAAEILRQIDPDLILNAVRAGVSDAAADGLLNAGLEKT